MSCRPCEASCSGEFGVEVSVETRKLETDNPQAGSCARPAGSRPPEPRQAFPRRPLRRSVATRTSSRYSNMLASGARLHHAHWARGYREDPLGPRGRPLAVVELGGLAAWTSLTLSAVRGPPTWWPRGSPTSSSRDGLLPAIQRDDRGGSLRRWRHPGVGQHGADSRERPTTLRALLETRASVAHASRPVRCGAAAQGRDGATRWRRSKLDHESGIDRITGHGHVSQANRRSAGGLASGHSCRRDRRRVRWWLSSMGYPLADRTRRRPLPDCSDRARSLTRLRESMACARGWPGRLTRAATFDAPNDPVERGPAQARATQARSGRLGVFWAGFDVTGGPQGPRVRRRIVRRWQTVEALSRRKPAAGEPRRRG